MAGETFPMDPDAIAAAFVEIAAPMIEGAGLEFATFALGVSFRPRRGEDDGVRDELKRAVKRVAGTALFDRWQKNGIKVDIERPDLRLVYHVDERRVAVEIAPLYVYGRYRKLVRTLPQTRWHCRSCRGRGCARCSFTGRQYTSSVEELIGEPLAELCRAGAEPILHGAGREDIDVRMLGTGRPFVVELSSPRVRRFDLEKAAAGIAAYGGGKVELAGELRLVDEPAVVRLKACEAKKTYRALCRAVGPVEPAALAALAASFTGVQLEQRTPERVAHRRADLVRRRKVQRLTATPVDATTFELELATESGTYVKELVSGDEGRTTPSVAAALGVACAVFELDVLDVGVEDGALLGDPSPTTAPPRSP